MGDLGRLQEHGRIRVDPARVLAVAQEAPQVLQALDRRECRVGPAVPKRAQRGDGELLQLADAVRLTEGEELAFEQLAAFLNRGLRQVARLRVFEVRLDRWPRREPSTLRPA